MEGEGVEIKAPGGNVELQNKSDPASTKSSSGKKRKQREFASPATDRPARERKSIERFIVSPDKEVKEFKIPKGAGTALKDIPNIVFKLSKRRLSDEVVRALHKVLFGRTPKHFGKVNILQFSGYVWSGNEEKEKAKVKEKLEKCTKESLFQISDLLDLTLSKSSKKEETVLKVFEFLESPYKISDKLVEETVKQKKSKKAKRTPVKGSKKKASGKSPKKSPKGAKQTSRRKKQTSDEEDESDAADFEDDVDEEPEELEEPEEPEEPEEKSDDDYAKESSSSKKRNRKSPKKESVQESADEEETLPKKKKPIKEVKKGKKKPIQEAKKEKKPKAKAEKVKEPSDEDLQEAICELLQNADFSKVTLTDVMKHLGQKFNTDFTHRKAHLKALIHEEIHKLVGDGNNEDEDGNNEGEIDDNGDKANGEEQEDASGGDPKADDEEADGDENAAEGDGDKEDGDDEKLDGEDEDEHGNSVEDKADGEDEVQDAKEEDDNDAGAEEGSTDMA